MKKILQKIKKIFENLKSKFEKLSKREQILITVLPVALFIFGWYQLIFLSYGIELNAKIEEKIKFEEIVDSKTQLVKTLNSKKETLQENEDNFLFYIEKYFIDFKEEYLLNEIFSLASESDIEINSIDIPKGELVEDETGSIYTLKINANGYKADLDNFIESIESFGKKLILDSYNISEVNYEEEIYQVDLKYIFGSLNIDTELPEILVESMTDDIKKEAFLIDFAKLAQNPRTRYPELKQVYEENLNSNSDEKTLSQLYAENRNIYSLGQLSTAKPFAINGDGVNSSLTTSRDNIINQTSYQFNYSIDTSQENLEATIGFNQGFIIEKQRDYISMWIKSETITGHEIHLELIDSTNEKIDILITSGVDWKDWQIKEIDLPININYPARITRLYITPSEYKQVKNGELTINSIQVADEKEDN